MRNSSSPSRPSPFAEPLSHHCLAVPLLTSLPVSSLSRSSCFTSKLPWSLEDPPESLNTLWPYSPRSHPTSSMDPSGAATTAQGRL